MAFLPRPWYSYGPVKLSNASYSSSIDIAATPSYSGSIVSVYHNRVLLASTGANITLIGGTQNSFLLIVLNGESDIQMQYEIVIISPKPACSSSELSEW